jgi:hypothetical protein
MKYLNYMFARAQKIARHNYLCYLNCDILLMQDFWNAFERAVRWRKRFLLVGQRWDTDITELIDFRRTDWEERVRHTARTQGLKQDLRFVDFFTFPKDLYGDVPPLVVGRGYWDWWLVANALYQSVPVVDCTPYMTAVHQNHDHTYSPGGRRGTQVDSLAMQNYQLAGGPECFRWTEDATHRLTRRGHVSKKFIRARFRTRATDFWLEAQRILTYKVRLPVWFFLLGVTRPIRSALGLRSAAVRRSRGKD